MYSYYMYTTYIHTYIRTGLYIACSAGILYFLLRPPSNKLKWTKVAEEDSSVEDLEDGK
jgi:hypothetical protein